MIQTRNRLAPNHVMHRPAGPATALAAERGSCRNGPAEPGPRQDHPPVMANVMWPEPLQHRLDSLGANTRT
jgi:hypothetical protein